MIEIRDVAVDDIPIIYAMGENVDEFRTSDQAPTFWPETVLRKCVNKSDIYFLTAVFNKEIVGFVIVNLNKSLSKALIENIFVKPDFRGRGIGTTLAETVIKRAKNERFQFIAVLTPTDDIPAIKTYGKAGFSKGETFLWLDA